MKSGSFLGIFAVGILTFSFAHADQPRFVDARDFDIAGVKTGMDYDQALAIMAKHFKIAPTKIGKNGNDYLYYENDGIKLSVHFKQRIPENKVHPLVVSAVIYKIPRTDANADAMKEAALTKYGKPSKDFLGMLRWCMKPCGDKEASLVLSGTEMSLHDPAWHNALFKHRVDSNARKPDF